MLFWLLGRPGGRYYSAGGIGEGVTELWAGRASWQAWQARPSWRWARGAGHGARGAGVAVQAQGQAAPGQQVQAGQRRAVPLAAAAAAAAAAAQCGEGGGRADRTSFQQFVSDQGSAVALVHEFMHCRRFAHIIRTHVCTYVRTYARC